MIAPYELVRCEGDPQSIGEALGESLRERIYAAQLSLASYEAFRVNQPWWMPYDAFLYFSASTARRMLELPIRTHFPDMALRLDGMSTTSRIGQEYLYLFHALEAALTSPSGYVVQPALAGCTALAIRGRRSADRQPLIAHNFDNVDVLRTHFILRERHEKRRYRALEFTIAPLCGAIDGINEHGLAISYDYGATMTPGAPNAPVSMAVSEALAQCRTVREAISFIQSRPCCGGALLMLADATGEIAAFEIAGNTSAVRFPYQDDWLSHSNTYKTDPAKATEVSADAVYSEAAPRLLRGKRVLESAEVRDFRMEELLRQHPILGLDEVTRVMSDHGSTEGGSDCSICMHGDYWATTSSLQLFPRERKIRIADGPTCQAQYYEFAL